MQLAFKTYLKGELGKLMNLGDAKRCIENIRPEKLESLGLPSTEDRLLEMFQNHSLVNAWVGAQNLNVVRQLTYTLDNDWRHNGVAGQIESVTSWTEETIPVENILVCSAEPGEQYRAIFERNEYGLVRLAQDDELRTLKPYSSYTLGTSVCWPVLLAKPRGEFWRVFDGVHRAYQMVLNGQQKIRLCVPA